MNVEFLKTLRALGAPEEVVARCEAEPYRLSDDEKQDYANRVAAVLGACERLVEPALLAEAMQARACCKAGFRLANARAIGKSGAPLEERLAMLQGAKYMGKPELTERGTILTVAVGAVGGGPMKCPCWRLSGRTPEGGAMPKAYCMCCAGHFRFHYEKALGAKLRLIRVVSSILESEGARPCAFEFEVEAVKEQRLLPQLARFEKRLKVAGVPAEAISEIMAGGMAVRDIRTPGAAEWYRGALARAEAILGEEALLRVRSQCACCTGGKRRQLADEIFERNGGLEARLQALDEEKLIVGHSARFEEGKLVVRFAERAEGAYCPCLPVPDQPMPKSYCACCGGHIKAHLERALGVRTRMSVRSSLLSSAGKQPCVFEFELEDQR